MDKEKENDLRELWKDEEDKPIEIPDDLITEEEINEGLEQEKRKKSLTSKEFEQFLDEVVQEKQPEEKKNKEQKPKSFQIETLQEKPEFDCDYSVVMKFPRASLPYLLKIYKRKATAAKVFDILVIEATKEVRRIIDGKRHTAIYGTKNIWIPLSAFYERIYRDKKKVQQAVELIANELGGLLHYRFTKKGKKEFLVIDIEEKTILKGGLIDYVKVEEEDYSLTNAELIFFRQLQAAMGPHSQQAMNWLTILKLGEIAYHYANNKKVAKDRTKAVLKKLKENNIIDYQLTSGSKYNGASNEDKKGKKLLVKVLRKEKEGIQSLKAIQNKKQN
jgi:hypothetical protein